LNIDVLCIVSSSIHLLERPSGASQVVNKEQERVGLVNETAVLIHHIVNRSRDFR
jgi:hypothetical protein